MKKSTKAATNVSNAKLVVTCSIIFLRIKHHVLPYLVGSLLLKKDKIGLPKGKSFASNSKVHPPQSKLSTTKAEEANNELVPKKAKILAYMEYSCQAPNGCSITR